MAINIKDVEHVAKLARLEFSEEKKEEFAKQLDSIVDYVEELKQVDIEGVKPANHVMPLKNVFREDKVEPSFNREELLKNAPDKKHGCFKVPRVVE